MLRPTVAEYRNPFSSLTDKSEIDLSCDDLLSLAPFCDDFAPGIDN